MCSVRYTWSTVNDNVEKSLFERCSDHAIKLDINSAYGAKLKCIRYMFEDNTKQPIVDTVYRGQGRVFRCVNDANTKNKSLTRIRFTEHMTLENGFKFINANNSTKSAFSSKKNSFLLNIPLHGSRILGRG